jgi:hypothetical protein
MPPLPGKPPVPAVPPVPTVPPALGWPPVLVPAVPPVPAASGSATGAEALLEQAVHAMATARVTAFLVIPKQWHREGKRLTKGWTIL